MDSDTMRKILLDVAKGVTPDETYTEEMETFWTEVFDELEEKRKVNPRATIFIPVELPD